MLRAEQYNYSKLPLLPDLDSSLEEALAFYPKMRSRCLLKCYEKLICSHCRNEKDGQTTTRQQIRILNCGSYMPSVATI
jgi:hypothetical protein